MQYMAEYITESYMLFTLPKVEGNSLKRESNLKIVTKWADNGNQTSSYLYSPSL